MQCAGKIVGAMNPHNAQIHSVGQRRCISYRPTTVVPTVSPPGTLHTGALPAHALGHGQPTVQQTHRSCIPFAAKGTEAIGESEPLNLSEVGEEEEVSIRRRPPFGSDSQACGPLGFKVPLPDANEPRNILEEIVWWEHQSQRSVCTPSVFTLTVTMVTSSCLSQTCNIA
eukprot:evm.model.scf_1683EXC.2 EVM.evm.TU.scf_1683EXC.2   scf_1683EXC:2683-4380(-)